MGDNDCSFISGTHITKPLNIAQLVALDSRSSPFMASVIRKWRDLDRMVDKKYYFDAVVGHQNNIYYVLACIWLINDEKSISSLQGVTGTFGDKYGFNFDTVVDLMKDPISKEEVVSSLLMMVVKASIKDSFELVKEYAIHTGRKKEVESKDWYKFMRMCRNCLSHSQVFEFRKYDESLLPVNWNGITIDSSCNGKSISNDFDVVKVRELFLEARRFLS